LASGREEARCVHRRKKEESKVPSLFFSRTGKRMHPNYGIFGADLRDDYKSVKNVR
jgi:hypothetical protein